jgi:hypothetical protein
MFDDQFRKDYYSSFFETTNTASQSTALTAGMFWNFVNQVYQAPINYAEDFAAWEEELAAG